MLQDYQYKFEPTNKMYARIKEEFNSYFESGVLNDTLFDTYTIDCLDKLGKGCHKLSHTILTVNNHQAELPDNFEDARGVWGCTSIYQEQQLPGYTYSQKMKDSSYKLYDDSDYRCSPCDGCDNPQQIDVLYRTTHTVIHKYTTERIFIPQRIIDPCSSHNRQDSYDVQGCYLITPLECGTLYMSFYEKAFDGDGDLQIPVNYAIQTYIREYIKYQMYRYLINNLSDESVPTLERKMQDQERIQAEKYILADIEVKKDTIYKKIHRINRTTKNNAKYEYPRTTQRRRYQ